MRDWVANSLCVLMTHLFCQENVMTHPGPHSFRISQRSVSWWDNVNPLKPDIRFIRSSLCCFVFFASNISEMIAQVKRLAGKIVSEMIVGSYV